MSNSNLDPVEDDMEQGVHLEAKHFKLEPGISIIVPADIGRRLIKARKTAGSFFLPYLVCLQRVAGSDYYCFGTKMARGFKLFVPDGLVAGEVLQISWVAKHSTMAIRVPDISQHEQTPDKVSGEPIDPNPESWD